MGKLISLESLAIQVYHKIWYTLNYFQRIRVKIVNANDTVDYIINHKCSISRYGDGELGLVLQYNKGIKFKSDFQDYDSELAKRLTDILRIKDAAPNHIVGLPGCVFGLGDSYLTKQAQHFWEGFSNLNINQILKCIDLNTTYYEAAFTRFYLSHRKKELCGSYIQKVKKIWEKRYVIIVEGQYSRLGIGNDLFHGASCIKRILCPAKNAFTKYNDIITAITQYARKSDLLLLALGQTATVLAYDLAKLGYQAIDLGHIDIEYEWYLQGATEKVAISNKYTNEVANGHINSDLIDPIYKDQIIISIE